ncbi:unnamed protein product, partial [Candidula unifasciata]
ETDHQDDGACADGLVRIHRGCYMFGLSALTWDNALADCKSRHGELLSIQSQKEKDEIELHINTAKLTEKQWWVALKREGSVWKWLDGVEISSQITPWISQLQKNKRKNSCGIIDMTTGALKISNDRCESELQYICEFHRITKTPAISNSTPVTPSRGATIFDDSLDTGVGDFHPEGGDIVGVQKAPGQKSSVTGGLFSSMMAVLSNKDAHTSPRMEPGKDRQAIAKTSTTAGHPQTVTQSSSGNEHLQETNGRGKISFSDKITSSSTTTTENYTSSKTETQSVSTENPLVSRSETSSASKSEISSASTTEKSEWPSEAHEASTSVQRSMSIADDSTILNRSESITSTDPTIASSTNPSRIQPDTPEPTMVDWAQAYSDLGDCYIPGTGGSLSAAVMTARKLYYEGRTSCPKVEIGGIEWPNVTAGDTARMRCAKHEGIATFHCGSNPVCWRGRPVTSGCASEQLQDVFKKILSLHGSVTPMSVNETLQVSSNLVEAVETGATTMEDVVLTADVITALSKMKATDESLGKTRAVMLMDNLVKTGSILVSKNKSRMWEAMSRDDKAQSASLLLVALETAVVSIAEGFNEPAVITKKDANIEMELRVVDVEELDGQLVYGSEQSDNTFSIPVETLRHFRKGKLVKAVFITHFSMSHLWNGRTKKPRISRQPDSQKLTDSNNVKTAADQKEGSTEKTTEREIVSHILSASLGKDKHRGLKLPKPVVFTMRHLEEVDTKYTPLCSFWDISHNKQFGYWSQDGCHILRTNKTHTTCECNHMTNFAILMDLHGIEMSKTHQSLLRLVSIIGCIISCVSLLASWVTFQCFTKCHLFSPPPPFFSPPPKMWFQYPSLWVGRRGELFILLFLLFPYDSTSGEFPVDSALQGERNSIHKNLAMTLLIAEILFVCGIDQARYQIACSVIAGFLHFFFLAAFAWMFIEGLHIIFMLVQVFDASRSRLPYYYLAGYGVPLAVVGTSALINYKGYGTDK